MSKKSVAGMIEWAEKALRNGWVYWYGTCGYACTLSLLKSKTKQYPSHYKSSRQAGYKKDVAEGRTCCDCIGLFKSYAWDKDGDIETRGNKYEANEQPDCSASMALAACKIKGNIDSIPEIPGLAVWNQSASHIGMYAGNGEVIEARGYSYDVCRTKLKDREFVTWGVYPYLEYTPEQIALAKEALKIAYKPVTTAIINTNEDKGLSLWDSPKKFNRIVRVKKNEIVNVLSLTPQDSFYYCEYNGEVGYADGQYLLFENSDDKDFAVINTNEDAGLSLWNNYKKEKRIVKVKKGEVVDVLIDVPDHGFYYCEYQGARGFADGQYLDFVKHKEEQTPAETVMAIINTNEDAGLSLWSNYKKAKRIIKVKKGEIVEVLSMKPDHNFYMCKYEGKEGYADGQYLKFISKEEPEPKPEEPKPEPKPEAPAVMTAKINTNEDAGLSLWNNYKKDERVVKVKKGEVVNVLSLDRDHDFYLCEYKGKKGYADGQYLVFSGVPYKMAKINTNEDAGLSLWDTYEKENRRIKVKKGEMVKVFSIKPDHKFYLCEYNGVQGYADGQYLLYQ